MQHLLAPADGSWPPPPRAAFGDVVGGLTIAGAVSAALYHRATTGEPSVIDASLLASGMWQVQPDIVDAASDEAATTWPPPDRHHAWNPLMLTYRTADGRYVALMMLAPDRHWAAVCEVLGRPGMASDPRFADLEARRRNAPACVEWLDEPGRCLGGRGRGLDLRTGRRRAGGARAALGRGFVMAGRRVFGTTWGGKAWTDALQRRARLDENRLPRGRTYARHDRVQEIELSPGEINARVQGSRPEPYTVRIHIRRFSDDLETECARLGRQSREITVVAVSKTIASRSNPSGS